MQQLIFLGQVPGDGQGTPNRVAWDRTNSNFTELYLAVAALQAALVSQNAPPGTINIELLSVETDLVGTKAFEVTRLPKAFTIQSSFLTTLRRVPNTTADARITATLSQNGVTAASINDQLINDNGIVPLVVSAPLGILTLGSVLTLDTVVTVDAGFEADIQGLFLWLIGDWID